jgi:glycosyltransferase involved in cell wall biosynthesis
MRVAQVAPLYEAVPPRLYGGTERIVAHLSDALATLGHEVTLFASAEAETLATLAACRDQAIRLDPSPLKSDLASHLAMVHEVYRRRWEFDIIHFHIDMIHFPFFSAEANRTVTTLHGRLDLKDLAGAYDRWREFPLVSISNDQRRPIPDANWQATVYHGLPRESFTFRDEPGTYLVYLGRMSPEKRVDRAIEIARGAGVPLKIAAKIYPEERHYFDETLAPLINASPSLVELIGEIGHRERDDLLGKAAAFLFPIEWPEPFGLVMIEALACGTPVIAWRRGSVPEVLEEGISGRIVDNVDDAVRAVHEIDRLSRSACRRAFEQQFDARRMAMDYLEVYRRVVPAG